MKRAKVILGWAIGISFITLGILKYVNLDKMSEGVFEGAHYPKWLFYAIGAVEFVGGLLILLTADSSKRLGSILIGIVMVGAIVTRYMLHQHLDQFLIPAAILLLAILMNMNTGTSK